MLVGVEEGDEGKVELVADVSVVAGAFDSPDVGGEKAETTSGLKGTGVGAGAVEAALLQATAANATRAARAGRSRRGGRRSNLECTSVPVPPCRL